MSDYSNARVLIVDDEDGMRHLLRKMLISLGYVGEHIIEKFSAEDAWNFLEEAKQYQVAIPNLVITDYNTGEEPPYDGHWLAKKINENFLGLPVILVSGNSQMDKCVVADFAAFLAKPYSAEELNNTISAVLF